MITIESQYKKTNVYYRILFKKNPYITSTSMIENQFERNTMIRFTT